MSKEKFVRTKPHVNIVGDNVLDGAAFSLCFNPNADLSTFLEARRLITSRGSSSWKEYLDDYWRTSSTSSPGSTRGTRNLMTKADFIAEIADEQGNNVENNRKDARVLASYNLTGCEPIQWEIRTNSAGFAEEALHFECKTIALDLN